MSLCIITVTEVYLYDDNMYKDYNIVKIIIYMFWLTWPLITDLSVCLFVWASRKNYWPDFDETFRARKLVIERLTCHCLNYFWKYQYVVCDRLKLSDPF